jgi:hypothetical protein
VITRNVFQADDQFLLFIHQQKKALYSQIEGPDLRNVVRCLRKKGWFRARMKTEINSNYIHAYITCILHVCRLHIIFPYKNQSVNAV